MTPEALAGELDQQARSDGYWLNPDSSLVLMLAEGLLTNEHRFGYRSCPCRLAAGEIEADRDIICPCEYRNQDVIEFGACYCGLFVDRDVFEGRKKVGPIPERRAPLPAGQPSTSPRSRVPVWRCVICGYLCGREKPPATCPICHAPREKFEPFDLSGGP
jgi:ferredoxin-thioredoxin reductase catalytic subunit